MFDILIPANRPAISFALSFLSSPKGSNEYSGRYTSNIGTDACRKLVFLLMKKSLSCSRWWWWFAIPFLAKKIKQRRTNEPIIRPSRRDVSSIRNIYIYIYIGRVTRRARSKRYTGENVTYHRYRAISLETVSETASETQDSLDEIKQKLWYFHVFK